MERKNHPIDQKDQDVFRKALAQDNGFVLYQQYGEREAADFLRLHPITLKKKRLKGEIAYLKKGSRAIAYLGFQLADYLIKIIQPCPTQKTPNAIKSETIGSLKELETQTGTELGSMSKPDKHVVSRLALATLKTRKHA